MGLKWLHILTLIVHVIRVVVSQLGWGDYILRIHEACIITLRNHCCWYSRRWLQRKLLLTFIDLGLQRINEALFNFSLFLLFSKQQFLLMLLFFLLDLQAWLTHLRIHGIVQGFGKFMMRERFIRGMRKIRWRTPIFASAPTLAQTYPASSGSSRDGVRIDVYVMIYGRAKLC